MEFFPYKQEGLKKQNEDNSLAQYKSFSIQMHFSRSFPVECV